MDLLPDPGHASLVRIMGFGIIGRAEVESCGRNVVVPAPTHHPVSQQKVLAPHLPQCFDSGHGAALRRPGRGPEQLQEHLTVGPHVFGQPFPRFGFRWYAIALSATSIAVAPLCRQMWPDPVQSHRCSHSHGRPQGFHPSLPTIEIAHGREHVGRIGALSRPGLEEFVLSSSVYHLIKHLVLRSAR